MEGAKADKWDRQKLKARQKDRHEWEIEIGFAEKPHMWHNTKLAFG